MLTSILYNVQRLHITNIAYGCDSSEQSTYALDMAYNCTEHASSFSSSSSHRRAKGTTKPSYSFDSIYKYGSSTDRQEITHQHDHSIIPFVFDNKNVNRSKVMESANVSQRTATTTNMNYKYPEYDKREAMQLNDWLSQDSETDSGFDTSDEGVSDGLRTHRASPRNAIKENMAANVSRCSRSCQIQTSPIDANKVTACSNQFSNGLCADDPSVAMHMCMLTSECQNDDDDEEVSRIFKNATPDHFAELDMLCSGFDSDCFRPYSPLNFDFNENHTCQFDTCCRTDSFSPVEFDLRPPDHVIRPTLVR